MIQQDVTFDKTSFPAVQYFDMLFPSVPHPKQVQDDGFINLHENVRDQTSTMGDGKCNHSTALPLETTPKTHGNHNETEET